MPIYMLTPDNPNSPAWEASTETRPCRVHAQDEKFAREYAHAALFKLVRNQGNAGGYRASPWMEPSLTQCTIMDRDPALKTYREGKVEVRHQIHEKGLGTLPLTVGRKSDNIENWVEVQYGNYGQSTLPSIRQSGTFGPGVSVATDGTAPIIQDRTLLQLHLTGLIGLLGEIFDPSIRRNSQRPELWHADDVTDAELRNLLWCVYDELRVLNSLLEREATQDTEVELQLAGFRKHADKFIDKFVTAVATGTGGLAIVMLGQVLVDVGFIQPANLVAIAKSALR